MKLNVDCTEVVNNTTINNWTYYNREEENYNKSKLDNVNWFLTASSDKLGKEICEKKLPKIYEKAIEIHKKKQEKWKLAKEKKEAKKRIKR